MLKEPAQVIAVKFDARLRAAIYDFGKQVRANTISDAVRSLMVLGLERAASVDSSILKAGYRAGFNRGMALVKETLLKGLNQEMSQVDATDDLTTGGEP